MKRRRHQLLLVSVLILVWSVALGWGLARANEAPMIGTVDPVPANLQLGQQLYLANCATCHLAISPAVLPDETWRQILQDPQHYGQQITPLVDPPRILIWNYLRANSRSIEAEEEVPYRVDDSRYFKALHPRIELLQPVRLSSCATCHPGASQYNFRSLAPEWHDAP